MSQTPLATDGNLRTGRRQRRAAHTPCGVVKRTLRALTCSAGLAGSVWGCHAHHHYLETIGNDTTAVDSVMHKVDQRVQEITAHDYVAPPQTLRTAYDGQNSYWEMSFDEAIQIAMTNRSVLRDLGAAIIRSPQTVSTEYQLALQETDPRFGIEAALSAFDAQLNASALFQNNDREFNNRFFGGGTNAFQQDLNNYLVELNKTAATGARFALRSITEYDANNAPGNLFKHAWQTQLEAEVRQPLLQGGGLEFNRIAGPGAVPGVSNGVLIAKVNNDINQVEFERSFRNYLSDVANAYWDLYFAYRDLDAKQQALDRSRETWLSYQAQQAANRSSGVAEALSREQFYRFESELQDAIAGKIGQRTQNDNGAAGGAFRGVNGVQLAERRLRLLIGVSVSDGRAIRPVDEPEVAPIIFDWETITAEALRRRPELKQQRLVVKRRELELLAAKNFLAPRLDIVGRYRLRGLDRNLAGSNDSAFRELGTGDFQEWEGGLEFTVPIGFRRAHAAVANAELQLCRDIAIQHEQERQIFKDLSDMVAEAERAYEQSQTNLNRYLAAQDALDALSANRDVGLPINLEQLLDAQRRLAEAQSRYYLSRVEYALALKNIQFEKGSLLEYSGVHIMGVTPTIQSTVILGQEGTASVSSSETLAVHGIPPQKVAEPDAEPDEAISPLFVDEPLVPTISVPNPDEAGGPGENPLNQVDLDDADLDQAPVDGAVWNLEPREYTVDSPAAATQDSSDLPDQEWWNTPE